MKLKELLKFVPDRQKIHLICGDLDISGDESAISCMLNDEVLIMQVDCIEADDNCTLKVFVKEQWSK